MKKFFLVLAVLMLAAPVMAEPNNITITATQVSSVPPAKVEITYSVTSGKIPRAFALDITVTAGTISYVDGFFRGGECDDVNRGYGIFPASFNRYINADDPCWADANYTPVADACDLPGDTLGGKGTPGVTIEMGSLYEDDNSPPPTGTLCSIFVDSDCHVDLALNVGRAGVVMEDGNQPDNIAFVEEDVLLVCTVPNVVDIAEADAIDAIEAAGFVAGSPTYECSDVIVTVGNVISTTPSAGVATCGTTVDIVVSTGPCALPCPWDVDGNGKVNKADRNAVSNYLNANAGPPFWSVNCPAAPAPCPWDVDGNGKVNKADRNAVSNYLNANAGPPFWSVNCP